MWLVGGEASQEIGVKASGKKLTNEKVRRVGTEGNKSGGKLRLQEGRGNGGKMRRREKLVGFPSSSASCSPCPPTPSMGTWRGVAPVTGQGAVRP